ncbi:GyrI-like domain-containing protein [bacterium]|nr:GyrI-like domain-containing protein [bacterium]
MPLSFNKINHAEPKIVTLESPIFFIGLGVKTDMKKIYKDASRLGKTYASFKKNHEIPNLKDPWSFVAYSRDFDESTRSWEYIMGDVVTSLNSVPEGLQGIEIPSGSSYAIFTIRARLPFLWGFEIGRMKRYVFTLWLPKSGYVSGGCDFELHDERSRARNPSIDLYVEVRRK